MKDNKRFRNRKGKEKNSQHAFPCRYSDLEEAYFDKTLTPDGKWIFKPNASLETHLYNASRRNAPRNNFVGFVLLKIVLPLILQSRCKDLLKLLRFGYGKIFVNC